MNRYEGAVCPVCGQAFTQADDVVVCPSCGTPHHRGCWMRAGQCANVEKHAAGFTWQEAPQRPEESPKQPEPGVVCPRCAAASPQDTLFCPRCGQPLGAHPAGGSMPGDPYAQGCRVIGDVPPGETIDGIPAAEVAAYVRTGTQSYVPKFFHMDRTKSKASWNWAAFIFSPFWFFYRKLYAAGAVVTSLLLALSVAFAGPAQKYLNAVLQLNEAMQQQSQTAVDAALAALQGALPAAALFLGLQLVMHFVCALVANRLYFKKMMGDLHALREQTLAPADIQLQLLRRGGASLLFGFGSYFLYDMAYMLVIQLLAML